MKSAVVIGASRGIGKQIAITLANNGYNVGVAAKTVQTSEKTPGTIYDVCNSINQQGGKSIPLQCDVRKPVQIENAINSCLSEFGHLDVAIYNAGAIMWKNVAETPLKRFDLMMDVNARGAYCMIQNVLPHFLERKFGKIILVSPPIYSRFFKGKTPYSVSKVGMTILTHGLAHELKGTGVSVTSLWPAATIESQVTVTRDVPGKYLRKPTIFADACLKIAQDASDKLNGKALIDEDYLRSEGVTDFKQYRCDSHNEPPRIMPKEFPDLTVEEENETFQFSKL